MITNTEEFIRILSLHQCVSVRIDLTKDLPVTVGREYRFTKKSNAPLNLVDLINAEDLTALLTRIDELSARASKLKTAPDVPNSLRVTCRFVPENKPYLICCEMRREKRIAKTSEYLFGVIMDVSEFHKNLGSDPVQQALSQRNSGKKTGNDTGITEIVGRDLLSKIQLALTTPGNGNGKPGLNSAILTGDRKFICSADFLEIPQGSDAPNLKKEYKYTSEIYIKINHSVAAIWVIASDELSLLERSSPIHEVLAESISKLGNAYLLLHNEMVNTEHANKLLSETIEQQMLLNNIYNKVLNEFNCEDTLQSVIDLTGEFLRLNRIIVCEDIHGIEKYRSTHQWASAGQVIPKNTEFKYTDYPELVEELGYYETYFSSNPKHNIFGMNFSSYVASNLNGDGARFGIIVYLINDPERVLTHAEKRLLRSISQIIAAVIMRCQDNEKLGNTARRLNELANRDPVLGVKNRAFLGRDIVSSFERGQCGAVVAFKIPNIKNINDFAGYEHADGLVMNVLDFIAHHEKGAEPYRFSDNIYMILLRNADAEVTKEFCDVLMERFSQPWDAANNGGEHYLEITAGVALYPESAASAEDLYRAAIMSLHKAGEYGVNSYAFFTEEFENPLVDNYYCAQVLRNAAENDMEGLVVKYTPIYSADSGEIVSCEALPVLSAPEDSESLYPPHFLMQIAEKMGLDAVIDTWVLKQACEFCKTIRRKIPAFKVSVNAAARSLSTGTIGTMLQNVLAETGLPPEGLMLQFSERVVAVNYERFIAALSELKKIGVSVTLDNFGSYYRATSLLRHSGINAVKADITVFTGTIDDFDDAYIARIIKLARDNEVNIGVKSIEADGIENKEEQLGIVKAVGGVDWYQGGFDSKAMSEEEMVSLLGNGNISP